LFLLGGIYQRFAFAGLEPLPFLVLAILAYIGDRHRDARIVADIYWLALMGLAAVIVLLLSLLALARPEVLDEVARGGRPANIQAIFYPGAPAFLAKVCLG